MGESLYARKKLLPNSTWSRNTPLKINQKHNKSLTDSTTTIHGGEPLQRSSLPNAALPEAKVSPRDRSGNTQGVRLWKQWKQFNATKLLRCFIMLYWWSIHNLLASNTAVVQTSAKLSLLFFNGGSWYLHHPLVDKCPFPYHFAKCSSWKKHHH